MSDCHCKDKPAQAHFIVPEWAPPPGWAACDGGFVNPENGICIPTAVLKGGAAGGGEVVPRDRVCQVTGAIPAGVNPVTGAKYHGVKRQECCDVGAGKCETVLTIIPYGLGPP